MKNYLFCTIVISILFVFSASAQLSKGGIPVSFQQTNKSIIPKITTDQVDVASLLAEDALEEKQGIPQRFGYPFDVNYTLLNSGHWETLPDGTKLWRLQIESSGAYSINLLYDNFWLANGSKLYIYNKDRSMVIGAFTSENNKEHKKFATAPVKGDVIILELEVPADVSYPGEISISRIVHAYRDIFNKDTDNFGNSGSCNNNVNCPEGDPWKDQINSVAMVLLGNGFRWCSGSMVNNVRQDQTPYFLTADHCLSAPESFIFMFNYQSPDCTNIDGPTYMTTQGSTVLAFNSFSDFALLLMDEAPPDSFNVFYSGWSNIDAPAATTVGIHHPSGDIKKISFNNNAVTSTGYYTTTPSNNSHWRVDDWEDGTTEGGSSGSPLYDPQHRIVGQLHGGNASCGSITDDWYGKFSASWDGSSSSTRLRDWLDPDNTGATTLDGLDASGLIFEADTTVGWVPFNVQFSATAKFAVDNWDWDFGDGNFATIQNPSNNYTSPGAFDVRLDISNATDTTFKIKSNYIIALADTLLESTVTGTAGSQVMLTLSAVNNVPIEEIILPVEYGGLLNLSYDSISTFGCRTDYFDIVDFVHFDGFNDRFTARLLASQNNTQPELEAGSGDILKLFFTINAAAQPGDTNIVSIDGYNEYLSTFSGSLLEYQPFFVNGAVIVPASCCVGIRGNIDGDSLEQIDIADLVYFVAYSFGSPSGPAPPCIDEADVDHSSGIDIADVVYLVNYMFGNPTGPAPLSCF